MPRRRRARSSPVADDRLPRRVSAAALVAVARVAPGDLIATQGRVLTVADLLSTLAVEATGREPLTGEDRAELGAGAAIPPFG